MSTQQQPREGMSSGRRIDPRIERTREAIGEALIALIEDKGFEAISVQNITERARVNRATFYLHYRSKEDLLIRTGEAVFERLAAEAGPIDPDNLDFQKPPQQLVILFQYIARRQSFFRAVLGKSGAGVFSARMREYLSLYTQQRIASLHRLYPDAVPILDDEFIGEYMAGAVLGVIIWWLKNNTAHSPEYMADRLSWLSVVGVYRMLGIEPPDFDTA